MNNICIKCQRGVSVFEPCQITRQGVICVACSKTIQEDKSSSTFHLIPQTDTVGMAAKIASLLFGGTPEVTLLFDPNAGLTGMAVVTTNRIKSLLLLGGGELTLKQTPVTRGMDYGFQFKLVPAASARKACYCFFCKQGRPEQCSAR